MRTSSIANFLLFRRFWRGREEGWEKEEGKERWHSWNFPASFFFISIRLLFSIPPYLWSQVLEVWSIDYMDPTSWPRAVCTSCCPDNPLTLTIFVQHRHFFLIIDYYSFPFFSFDLSSIPRLLATSCSLMTRYLLPSLLSSKRESMYIHSHLQPLLKLENFTSSRTIFSIRIKIFRRNLFFDE